jgi:hypothetical protein
MSAPAAFHAAAKIVQLDDYAVRGTALSFPFLHAVTQIRGGRHAAGRVSLAARMHKLVFMVILLQSTARAAVDKVELINVSSQLKTAEVVAPVKIVSYGPDFLKCELQVTIGSGTVMCLEGWPCDFKWGHRGQLRFFRYSRQDWNQTMTPDWRPPIHTTDNLSSVTNGSWPPLNTEVLLIADQDQAITLLAADHAIFVCDGIARPVEGSKQMHSMRHRDGCLVPVSDFSNHYSWGRMPRPLHRGIHAN